MKKIILFTVVILIVLAVVYYLKKRNEFKNLGTPENPASATDRMRKIAKARPTQASARAKMSVLIPQRGKRDE